MFVSDISNNRVLVFNVANITNGMNASFVLGQSNFTNNSPAASQNEMSTPEGLALDEAANRLFVTDQSGNRILVFDVSSLSNGMNASNVIGQTTFAASGAGVSQSKFSAASGVAFDRLTNRLFAADYNNDRVLVFDVSSITDGMNASNVLGFAASTTASVARRNR